ncbi:MAG: outer membrane beta-barrel protein [Chlorobium sp.]|nr:MAG: porin family protein [Chlorobium sp.]
MKKIVSGLVCLLIFFFSQIAGAVTTPYVCGSIGLAMLSDSHGNYIADRSFDSGHLFSGSLGLDSGRYRVEAELGYQKNGVNNSSSVLSMTTYMANGFVNVELPLAPVKPFVLAGLGIAKVDDDNGFGLIVGDRVFAWQIGAGAGFSIAPMVNLDAQYRYFTTTNPELAGYNTYRIGSHNVILGLRIGL